MATEVDNGPAAEVKVVEKEEGEITPQKVEAKQKHELEHEWTLWFDNPQQRGKGGGWGNSLRSIYSFKTAEDFWW